MQYLVGILQDPIPAIPARALREQPRRADELQLGNGAIGGAAEIPLPREAFVKVYCSTLESARAVAKKNAEQNPGKQFAIFQPTEIFESVPKVIEKMISETGEIVPKG
jgi:hypothetical protein